MLKKSLFAILVCLVPLSASSKPFPQPLSLKSHRTISPSSVQVDTTMPNHAETVAGMNNYYPNIALLYVQIAGGVKAGDIVHVDAITHITNPDRTTYDLPATTNPSQPKSYVYTGKNVLVSGYLMLATSPTATSGTEVTFPSGENATTEEHHHRYIVSQTFVVPSNMAQAYVMLMMRCATDQLPTGAPDVCIVDPEGYITATTTHGQ